MYTKMQRRKNMLAVLIAAFILGNILLVTPAFASADGQRTPAGPHTCWPIWPLCWPTPTPTPGSTSTPTPGPTATPDPRPTGTPQATSTPTRPPIHLAATTSFTMSAVQIVGTNARLNLASDPRHPILTFASVTIQGLRITHLSFVLSASGTATGSGVAIKTSVFQELVSALVSFTNKADLLILLAGGTVHTLTMRHVSLQIDRYIDMQALTIQGLHLTF